jgi:hypothetical protein
VVFASWGTPGGYCPDHLTRNASCDSPAALAAITAACVGRVRCDIQANRSVLGDPCPHVIKSLAVQVTCSGVPPPPPPPPPPPASYVAVFEKEFQGGLRLDVANGSAGATVAIACGESLNGTVVGDTWGWAFTWTLRDGAQTLEQHKYMECRFVSLVFSEPVQFTLSAWTVHYPWAEEDSSFASSNDTLDAVYDLCRYTVHAAALDTYTDSNTRERTPYEVCVCVFVCVHLPLPHISPGHVFSSLFTPPHHSFFNNSPPPPASTPCRPTASLQPAGASWCSATTCGGATATPLCCSTPPFPWSGNKSRHFWGTRTTLPRGSLT